MEIEEQNDRPHRHLDMEKSRTQLLIAIGLVIFLFGIAFFTFSRQKQETAQTFPATIGRDCAPWDGAAFTLSIQYDPTSSILISIWKSPDIKLPAYFRLPNGSGNVGQAYIVSELDPLIPLSGKVFFLRVEPGRSVEGHFDLMDESGKRFNGLFSAEWKNEAVYCG